MLKTLSTARWSLRGFALIELVSAIAILSIVAGITILILGGALRSHFNFMSEESLLGRGRAGFEHMIEDLRSIRSPDDIVSYSSHKINFFNTEGIEISIAFDAGSVLCNGQIVLDGLAPVTGFQLTYYDLGGNIVSDPDPGSLIRLVALSVILEERDQSLALSTTVFPRNFHPGVAAWVMN